MYTIHAKWGRKIGANGLDVSSRFQSGLAIKSGGNLAFRSVLLVAMLGLSSIANAQYCPQNFDGVAAPALPAGWTASVLTGAVSPWVTSTASAQTTPNAAFAADPATVTDNVLASPATPVTAANSKFYFRHFYNTESTFDGGVLEISINGGAFTDILVAGGSFSVGGYSATISTGFSSPIAGRMAWSGNSGGFIVTGVTLPAATIGQSVAVRWRAASDNSNAATGWRVDSILCGAAPPPTPWSLVAPYPIPILDQGMTNVGNALYGFGGATAGALTALAYRFNGTAWSAIAALPVAVHLPAVASDGTYAYIIGGLGVNGTTSSGYRYDPVANNYSSIAPSPTATAASAAVFLDGKIYKIGGTVVVGASETRSNAVEVYNIAGNDWSTVASYPLAASFLSAFARDPFIYAAGGIDGTNLGTAKGYRYDPATNAWNDIALADLPQSRWGAASARFHDGGLMAGGFVNGGGSSATALQWNAQTNTWTALPGMLEARARLSGGVLRGCFFAAGGRSATGAGTNFAGTIENQKLDCVFYDGFEN